MNVSSLISGKSRQLGGKAVEDETVSEADVTDVPKMARLLTRIVRELASFRRRFVPRRVDFEDAPLTAGGSFFFPHGLGGRVRWWVVDATGDIPMLLKDPRTDADTLWLASDTNCTITLRIEEVG